MDTMINSAFSIGRECGEALGLLSPSKKTTISWYYTNEKLCRKCVKDRKFEVGTECMIADKYAVVKGYSEQGEVIVSFDQELMTLVAAEDKLASYKQSVVGSTESDKVLANEVHWVPCDSRSTEITPTKDSEDPKSEEPNDTNDLTGKQTDDKHEQICMLPSKMQLNAKSKKKEGYRNLCSKYKQEIYALHDSIDKIEEEHKNRVQQLAQRNLELEEKLRNSQKEAEAAKSQLQTENKALGEEILSLQSKVKELTAEKRTATLETTTLREELFRLSSSVSQNLVGKFPLAYELIVEYQNFREQQIMTFLNESDLADCDNTDISLVAFSTVMICDQIARDYVTEVKAKIFNALCCEPTPKEITFVEEHLRSFHEQIFENGKLLERATRVFESVINTNTCEEPYVQYITQRSYSVPTQVWQTIKEKEQLKNALLDILGGLLRLLFKLSIVSPRHFHDEIPKEPEMYNSTAHDWFIFAKGQTQIDVYAFPALRSDTSVAVKAKVLSKK